MLCLLTQSSLCCATLNLNQVQNKHRNKALFCEGEAHLSPPEDPPLCSLLSQLIFISRPSHVSTRHKERLKRADGKHEMNLDSKSCLSSVSHTNTHILADVLGPWETAAEFNDCECWSSPVCFSDSRAEIIPWPLTLDAAGPLVPAEGQGHGLERRLSGN